jgi:hypothetical protein
MIIKLFPWIFLFSLFGTIMYFVYKYEKKIEKDNETKYKDFDKDDYVGDDYSNF